MPDPKDAKLESVEDVPKKPGPNARRWLAEIQRADKEFVTWRKRSTKIIKRYRDERGDDFRQPDLARRSNILWSNVQTLQPAVYSQVPKPQVERRFKDADELGRVASQVLERATSFCVNAYNFNDVMNQVVQDYLLTGRGTA